MTIANADVFAPGFKLREGEELNQKTVDPINTVIDALNAQTTSVFAQNVLEGVTAHAGGTQAAAFQLTGHAANVTVVATAADSVALPLAVAGAVYFLQNSDAADSMQVFGAGTDTINNVATATGVAQAAGKSGAYFCTKSAPAGKWFRVLSA